MSDGRREVASSKDRRRSTGLEGNGSVLGSDSENEGGRDRAKEFERKEPERDDPKEPERDGGSNGLSQGPGAVVRGCDMSTGVNGRPISDDRPDGVGVNGLGPATGAEGCGGRAIGSAGCRGGTIGAEGGGGGGAGPEYDKGSTGNESGPGGVIGGGKAKFPNILDEDSGGSGGRVCGFGRM